MLKFRTAAGRLGLAIAGCLLAAAAMAQTSISVNNANCPGATAAITYGGSTGVAAINIQTNGCGTTTTPTAPTITSGTPTATANVGAAYSFTFTAAGTAPISWSLGAGSNLPPGLGLSTGGVLSGTPTLPTTAAPWTYTFSVVAGNGTAPNASAGPFTITVDNLPAITSSAPAAAVVNMGYTHNFTASQAITTWSTTGTLPPGLIFGTSGANGVLAGTPTVAGSYPFTVSAMNGSGTATQNVTLVVNAAGVAPTITAFSPPAGMVNSAYTYTFAASGSAPITWGSTGTLPTGLTLNTTSGVLSGTPTAAGTFMFTITASNGTAPNAATGTLSVTIAAATGGASAFDISVDDGAIPTPSKFPNVPAPYRQGKLNGAGVEINAYAAESVSCGTSNAQLGANAGIVRRWQHNIDFGEHQINQGIDYISMAPRESLTYMFTAPTTQGVQRIQFQRDTSATWVPVMMSLSTTPCDFDQTKLNAATRNYCYVADNNIYYQMTNGTASAPYCALKPGTKYYFNMRFLRVSDLNNDPCSLTSAQRCGGVLQVQ